MSKKRILILENSADVTGALNSILRSSESIRDKFDFIFALPSKSKAINHVKASGFEVYSLPMRELRKDIIAIVIYLPFLLINMFSIWRLLRKTTASLVVSNDFYNLLPPLCKAFGHNVPYICYVRFRPSKFPAWMVKAWCKLHERYASSVVVVSSAVFNEMPSKSKVVIIGNELPHYHTEFVPSKSKVLLYPANYTRGKGQEYALQSFALICRDFPDWKLRFIGSDMGLKKNREFKNSLQDEAKKRSLDGQVEWGGFVSEIGREYMHAAIVLNFSESESFSLTCLEAGYYGRCVISTRSGGPSEIINNNETGVLVNVAEISSMASAMKSLMYDAEARERLGRNAYSLVRERFSFQKTSGKLMEVYARAIKEA